MVRHNNQIPNAHFHKDWQRRVKTWFNQPARKVRRRLARKAKAEKVFPRPVAGSLRPIVSPQTARYNVKSRLGRGFTLEELKEASIPPKFAATIGIAVDRRRKNRSLESQQANVARLKAYTTNLVVYPRRSRFSKKDKPEMLPIGKQVGSAEEMAAIAQNTEKNVMDVDGSWTAQKPKAVTFVDRVTDEMKSSKPYYTIRLEHMNTRLLGKRKKAAEDAAAKEKEEAMLKKK